MIQGPTVGDMGDRAVLVQKVLTLKGLRVILYGEAQKVIQGPTVNFLVSKFFGHTSGSPLLKKSRQSEDLGMTDYTTSERDMRLSMLYGPNTTHTCPLTSWDKTVLKSDQIGTRESSIMVNVLTTKLVGKFLDFYKFTLFSPDFEFFGHSQENRGNRL